MVDTNEQYEENEEPEAKCIAILGPSRIGKTSTIASFVRAAEEQLQGTSFQFIPRDTATRQRLNRNNNELNGAIRAGELGTSTKYNFNEGALAGTSQINNFNLVFQDVDQPELGLPIDIVDFPGGWLDSVEDEGIDTVRAHLRKSPVLILPIDALVVMEANTSDEQIAVPGLLAIEHVKSHVEEWAKARRKSEEVPRLILVPVKCEEYVSPGSREKLVHKQLEERVLREYAEMLDIAFKTVTNLVVEYAPLETIGCLRRTYSEWDFSTSGEAQLNTKFRVIQPGRRQVRGAEPLIRAAAGLLKEDLITFQAELKQLREEFATGVRTNINESRRLEQEVNQAGWWDKFVNFFDEHLDQKSRYAVEYASYAAEYEVALHEAVEHLQIVEEQLGNLMHLPEPDHAISRTITARDVEKVLRAEEERYA